MMKKKYNKYFFFFIFEITFQTVTSTKSLGAYVGTNKCYKIEFDCASGSSNGLITVNQVEYKIQKSS